jgi:hypothetical protein
MTEEIKKLYSQLNHKTDFMLIVAKDLNKKPNTLKNHWFSGFFSIPDEYQERVIELLKITIKKQ